MQVDNRAPVGVVLTSKPVRIPTASRHSAFPSIAQAPDGTLTMVWRGGTDHANLRDGSIRWAYSTDQGQTWRGETVLKSGQDFRDPSISYIPEADGAHRYITYFTGSAANGAEGAWVMRDSQPPVRVDGGLPYAAISAPVVRQPDGRLAVAFYGKQPGETVVTAWMAWSTDQGATWVRNRILNDGTDHAEPVLLIRNGVLHLLARGGGDTIVMRSSIDGTGRSGTWDTPHVIVGACTGRPSAIVTAAGTMVMVCRGILPSPNAQVAYSVNGGQKWWWGPLVQPAPTGSFGMTYASLWEERPGTVVEVGGMEAADGSSTLAVAGLAESIG